MIYSDARKTENTKKNYWKDYCSSTNPMQQAHNLRLDTGQTLQLSDLLSFCHIISVLVYCLW